MAQPGWESPSVNPLKGIPLPPSMPPLPPADAPLLSDDFGMGKGFGTDKGGGGGSAGGSAGGGGSDDGFDEADGDTKVGAGGLSKEQKLTQRMQRKAESARVARLRKKEYVSGLEAEVASLRAELTQLREKGASADTPTLKEEGQRHRASMEALLKQSVLDTPEVNATEVTVEKYVANKRAQQVRPAPPASAPLARRGHPMCATPPQSAGDDQRVPRFDRGYPLARHAAPGCLLRVVR